MSNDHQSDSEDRKADDDLSVRQAQIEEFLAASDRRDIRERVRRYKEKERLKAEEREAAKHADDLEQLQASPFSFKLYDQDEVKRRLADIQSHRDSEQLKTTLIQMSKESCIKLLVPQPANFGEILDELNRQYPHFASVTDSLRSRMLLNGRKSPSVLDFSNLLLVGPAGCGKSSYLSLLGQLMGTVFSSITCAATSNGFDLCGLSSGWSTGKAGNLHRILVKEGCPNPIILLDEIDKAAQDDDKHPLMGTLYGLLEPNNAHLFKDEFVGVSCDASRINWIASANDTSLMDAPILDRFEAIEVPAPSVDDLRIIVPRLYQKQLDAHGLISVFESEINHRVIELLASGNGQSIRSMKLLIDRALSRAIERSGDTESLIALVPADLRSVGKNGVQRVRQRAALHSIVARRQRVTGSPDEPASAAGCRRSRYIR